MAKRLKKKSIAEEMRDRATGNNQTYTVEERKDVAIPKQDMTPTPTLQDRINKHYIENMQNLANTTMNMVTNTVKRNPIVNSFMAGFNTGKNVELPQNQVKTIQNAVKKDLQTNTQDKRNPYTIMQDKNNQKKEEEEKHKSDVSYKPYQLPQAQEMVNKNQQEVDERKKNEEAQGLLSQVQNRTLPQAQKQEEVKKPTLTESIEEYLRTGDIRKSAGNYFKSQFEGGKQGAIEFGQYYNETLPSKVEGDSWTKRKSEEQYRAKEYREGLLNDVKQNPNNYSKEQKSFIKNQQEFTEKYGDNFYEAYKNESKEKVNKMIEEAPTEIDRKLIEIGQSNGRSTVGAGFSMLSPIAGTMYFYGSSAQSYYDAALEMGMAESDAWKYANVMGAWETVSEELIAANRVDQVNKILTGSNIGKTGMKFLGNSMVENAFQEALSEPIDDITKSMLNYSYLNEGQLGERMLESGMIGAISALLMDSPTAVLSAPGDVVNLYNKSVEKIGKKATIEKMQKGAETYYAQILSEINNGLGNDAYEMMRNQNIQEENQLQRLLPGEYENQQEIDRTRDEKLQAITEDMTEGDKTAYLIQNSNLSQEEKDSLSRVARRLNVSADQIDDLLKFNEEQKQIQSENKELEQMIDNSNLSQAQIGEVLSQKSFEEAKNKINELTEENNANQEAIKTLGLNISEENKEGNISYKEKQNIEINDSDTLESSYKKYFGESETSFVKRLKNLDKAAIESGQNVKLVFDGNYFKDDNGNILTGVEAAFVTKDGKRVIAVNPYATTGKAFEQVLAHELTHAVLSEENADTQALYKSVQDYLTSKGEYDNIVKDLKGLYGKNYNEEEVVAKTIERLFNSKEELNSLANAQPNIFTRIYRSLVGMYAKITGSEKAYIKKLKLDMELAWKNSNNKGSLQDAIKNSITETSKTDSQGRTLTKKQQNFLKNTKAIDDNGNPIKLYHGTNQAGFSKVNNYLFLTTNREIAQDYAGGDKTYDPNNPNSDLTPIQTNGKNSYFKNVGEIRDNINEYTLGDLQAIWDFIDENNGFSDTINGYDLENDLDKQIKNIDSSAVQDIVNATLEELNNWNSDDTIPIPSLSNEQVSDSKLYTENRKIYEAYANIENPLEMNLQSGKVTNEMINRAKQEGYDGIIAHNTVEGRGNKKGDTYIVFNENQLIDANNDNIKYSIEDSQGRKLTKEQQEFFKDSKVRDENGNLLTVYHGTNEDFNIFKANKWVAEENGVTQIKGYFSTDPSYSEVYGDVSPYYLNIKNPLELKFENGYEQGTLEDWKNFFESKGITGIKFDSSLYEPNNKGFTDESGNKVYGTYEILDATEYWNGDGNLTEKIKEAGYDGLVWTEGFEEGAKAYMPFEENAIKKTNNTKPTINPDIRYSVETRKDGTLLALHNLTADKLKGVLDLGGFPVPSIAITNKYNANEEFGDISVIFDKNTIDPSNKENEVYDKDVYSKTVPEIYQKVDKRVLNKVMDSFRPYESTYGSFNKHDYSKSSLNSIVKDLKHETAVKAKFLEDSGYEIKQAYKDFKTSHFSFTPEAIENFRKKYPELASFNPYSAEYTSEITEKAPQIKEIALDMLAESDKKIPREQWGKLLSEDFYLQDVIDFYHDIREYDGNSRVKDRYATRDNIDNAVKEHEQEFEKWLTNQFQDVYGDSYFENEKGRKFEYTLDNIISFMKKGTTKSQQLGMFNSYGIGQAKAETAKKMTSIDEIRDNASRLTTDEEIKKARELFEETDENLRTEIGEKRISEGDDLFDVYSDYYRALAKTANGTKPEVALKQFGFNDITDEQINSFKETAIKLKNLPMKYFEAKPQRAVGLDEVKALVIPNNLDADLRQQLVDRGMRLIEYDPNIEGDREAKLKSAELQDLRFSKQTETADEILDRLLEKYRGKGERTYLPGIPKNLPKDYIMELGNKIEQMSISDDRKLELYNLANTNDWNEESYNNFITDLDAIEQDFKNQQQRDRFTTKSYDNPDRAKLITRKRNEFNKDYHYNDTLVDEIDSLLPRNRNGKRLVREWKKFARELGKRLALDNYTPDEIEDIAVKSYYDLQPTKNITQYDKGSKAPRERLYANDWVNSVYEGLNEAGYDAAKFSITDNGQNNEQPILPKKELSNKLPVGQVIESKEDSLNAIREHHEKELGDTINLEDIQNLPDLKGDKLEGDLPKTIDRIVDKRTKEKVTVKEFIKELKKQFVNKAYAVDKLAKQTGNKKLTHKYDRQLMAFNEAQVSLGDAQVNKDGRVVGKSLIETFKKAKDTGLDKVFADYLENKNNIARDKLGESLYGADVTAVQSRKIVEEYEKKYPQFKEWANDVSKYNDNLAESYLVGSFINQELWNKLKQLNPDYVPAFRDIVETKGLSDSVDNVGFQVLKRAEGGSSKILTPKEAMAEQTVNYVKAYRKNETIKELYKTIKGELDSTDILYEDMDTVPEIAYEMMREAVGKDQDGHYTATFFENGKATTFKVGKDIFDAFVQGKGIEAIEKNAITKVLGGTTRNIAQFQRNAVTTYSIPFLIKNMVRDYNDALINTQYSDLRFMKNYAYAYLQMIGKGKYYQQYKNAGGGANTYYDYEKGLLPGDTKNPLKKFMNKVVSLNEYIETAPRLAEFISTMEKGGNLDEALYNAAEITTNFKRGGDTAKLINKYGANFFNASIQGADKVIRNITGQKGLKGYANLAVKTMIAGVAPSLLNHILISGSDDPEERKAYEELQDYIKNNYYLIYKGNGDFYRIPKGRIAGTIGAAAVGLYRTTQGEDDAFDGYFKNVLLENLAPNNPLTNNIIAPVLQAKKNDAWYDGTIYSETKYANKLPMEVTDEKVDDFSNLVAKGVNALFDDETLMKSKTNNGWLDILANPKKLNYVLDQYSGGFGDIVLPQLTPRAENNFIADQFTTSSVLKNKYVGEFYDMCDNNIGNSEYATDFDKLTYKYLNNMSKEVGGLYKEKHEIEQSDLPDDEKMKQSREKQKEINELCKEAVETVKGTKVTGNTAEFGGQTYYKDNEDEWKKISEDSEMNMLYTVDATTYADWKNKTTAANKAKKESEGKGLTDKEKDAMLVNSTYRDEEKEAIYMDSMGKDDDVYKALKIIAQPDIDEYLTYQSQTFESDRVDDGTAKGKAVTKGEGTSKNKTINYLDNSNMSSAETEYIKATKYKLDSTTALREYIDSLNLSEEDYKTVMSNIKDSNVVELSDGTWKWK